MVKTIGISDLRKDISAKVNEVHEKHSRYIIIQRSKPKAVLMSLEELETLEIMAGRGMPEEIEPTKEDIETGRSVSFEEFFDKKLADRLK